MSQYTPHTESNGNTGLENLDLYGKKDNKTTQPLAAYKPLSELNLEVELAELYGQAKAFLDNINPADVPANQISQVYNTINTILKEIVKTQTELHDAERSKRVEAAIIQLIKTLPIESQTPFIDELDRILKF
jgi:hypothetical protein